MKKPSIYPDRSQELLALFEQAGNNSKVMCVSIDYAKKDHLVMFCNGNGDVLRKPFSVKNSVDGVKYLLDQVSRSCCHRHIRPEHVFFGGEDVNSYAENFANTLRSNGWLVGNVNAHDAKKQRENLQASTDRIDLMGIAAMLLSRRANCCPAQSGIYRNLRTLVRHRKKLVKMKTEVRNRTHTIVDRLFPGFLNENKSGIVPFSSSSLYLMQDRFSAPQIRRRKRSVLIRHLEKRGTQKAEKVAAKLQDYATHVLTTPDEYTATLQISLSNHVTHFRCLLESTQQLVKEMALLLAQTQGAFLTSIKGIGIVLASGVTAEIGDPVAQRSTDRLVSYAGIIPKVKQSGGSQGPSVTGRVSKRSNHLLKDFVVQSAYHIGHYGPKDLQNDYSRREAAGQHAGFGIARRFIRIAMSLMRTSQVYLPPDLRSTHIEPEHRADYYLSIWPYLKDKWSKIGALDMAFAKDNPLGQWRYIVKELYGIKLKL
ncbi:MAG: IS110 family transposase [Proteobacteria bacterium]|nr:IS110 family transposase [Pseudomonadota bacterium]